MPHPRYEFQAAFTAACLVSGAGLCPYHPPAPPGDGGKVSPDAHTRSPFYLRQCIFRSPALHIPRRGGALASRAHPFSSPVADATAPRGYGGMPPTPPALRASLLQPA